MQKTVIEESVKNGFPSFFVAGDGLLPDSRGAGGRADAPERHLHVRGHRHPGLLRPHGVRKHDRHR